MRVYKYALDNELVKVARNGSVYKYYQREKKYKKAPIHRIGRNKGYQAISISVNKKQYNLYVHRLVALAYISNPDNKTLVMHLDNNPLNNDIDNLVWVTPQERMQYSIDNGFVDYEKNMKECAYCDNLTRAEDQVCTDCKYDFERAEKKAEKIKEIRKGLDLVDIRALTQREREIVYLRYIGKTYEEIAKKYNVTRQAIEQLIEKTKTKSYKNKIYPNLELILESNGLKARDIACRLDLSQTTVYSKLGGVSDWKLKEAIKVKRLLKTDMAIEKLFKKNF